jgi:hypothetical protein
MGNNGPYTSPIKYTCVTVFSATKTSSGNIECFLDPILKPIDLPKMGKGMLSEDVVMKL